MGLLQYKDLTGIGIATIFSMALQWGHIMVSQITSGLIACSTVCSSWLPIEYQSFALLALCEGNSTVTVKVSCQKGPTRHAYAWQIGLFWQDTLVRWFPSQRTSYIESIFMLGHCHGKSNTWIMGSPMPAYFLQCFSGYQYFYVTCVYLSSSNYCCDPMFTIVILVIGLTHLKHKGRKY